MFDTVFFNQNRTKRSRILLFEAFRIQNTGFFLWDMFAPETVRRRQDGKER